MRELTRDRRAAESSEQRAARLHHVREQMRDRLVAESAEQREARLQQMRDRLAAESAEPREARLQQMGLVEVSVKMSFKPGVTHGTTLNQQNLE